MARTRSSAKSPVRRRSGQGGSGRGMTALQGRRSTARRRTADGSLEQYHKTSSWMWDRRPMTAVSRAYSVAHMLAWVGWAVVCIKTLRGIYLRSIR